MWLNCKVVKKWQLPPPFQVYPSSLGKYFVPPLQMTQILEGPTPLPINKGGGRRGGGGPTKAYQIKNPQEAMFPLLLNASYHCLIIKPANGSKVQPLHTWLNNIFRNQIHLIWNSIVYLTSTEYCNLIYEDSWPLAHLTIKDNRKFQILPGKILSLKKNKAITCSYSRNNQILSLFKENSLMLL